MAVILSLVPEPINSPYISVLIVDWTYESTWKAFEKQNNWSSLKTTWLKLLGE